MRCYWNPPRILRDGRRGGQSEPQRIWILVFVSPSVPELGRTVILRSATGQHDTTHVTLPHTICSRLRYQQPESWVHLSGTDSSVDAVFQQQCRRVHTRMDTATSGYPHKHSPHIRLSHQTDEDAHRLLRQQDDRRHPATHQRPQAHTGLSDREQPQRYLLRVQYHHLRHCVASVQRYDISHFHVLKCPVRCIRLVIHEEACRTGS